MPRHAKPWTAQADEILRKAVFDGRSLERICEELGRSRSAVRSRAQVLGLSLQLAGQRRRNVSKWS
jgi:DNA-directed RNA polymerase specialized sigma24 family protein